MERNKQGGKDGEGGGGGCVLTAGMSAALWVIKKEMPTLPLWEADSEAAGEVEPRPGLITLFQPVQRGEAELG